MPVVTTPKGMFYLNRENFRLMKRMEQRRKSWPNRVKFEKRGRARAN